MRRWRIFYDDRTSFDWDSGLENAPGLGVLVVVQEDEDVGRELLHMKDFYYWDEGRWMGCDMIGLIDYLQRPGLKKVLIGRNTTHQNYHSTMLRAQNDGDFPPKSARHVIETA